MSITAIMATAAGLCSGSSNRVGGGPACPRWIIPLAVILALTVVLPATPAVAGWLRPLTGGGNFYFHCDLVTLSCADGSRDVVAMVAVPHRELIFENDAGRQRARVRAVAVLTTSDGRRFEVKETYRLTARNATEAGSPTLNQIFTIVLHDVAASSGDFEIRLEDLNRRRPGFMNLGSKRRAVAVLAAGWYAPPVQQPRGLSVGDAIFLAHAPIRSWESRGRPTVPGMGGPWEYVNPQRRFGLETESVQIYFTLEPPALVEDRRRSAGRNLRLEVVSDHLDFSLVDTVRLTRSVREALAAGSPAAVYWEMDVGGLPPGSFRLSIAPFDTVGRGVLTGFDMVWSLALLTRHTDDLLGEGRTVFMGADLRSFQSSSRVEQEAMLNDFWEALDPTPEDRYNEVYVEFRRRVAVVSEFYGGFDEMGATDPRGRLYILLGRPSSVRAESMPMNDQDLNDARILVYERYAPERLGATVKEGSASPAGGQIPYVSSYQGSGVIPLPYSYLADRNIRAKANSPDTGVFELWRYEDGGAQLFPNTFSGQGHGLRFLFLDKTGQGKYVLDSDNSRLMGN